MTFDYQLDDWCKKLKIPDYNGTFKLQDDTGYKKKGSYIINLNGQSHWCLLLVDKDGKARWFDSFGVVPPQKIVKLFPKVSWNKTDFQKLTNQDCGQYCVLFDYLCNKYGWKEAEKIFHKHCLGNSRWMMNTLHKLLNHGKGLTVDV